MLQRAAAMSCTRTARNPLRQSHRSLGPAGPAPPSLSTGRRRKIRYTQMTRQHWVVAACLAIAGFGIAAAAMLIGQTPPAAGVVPFQVPAATLRYEADRETWNRPSDVITALALNTGGAVADVGAGG